MGHRIANPKQAVQAIEELSGREALLCIWLFDDRPSGRSLIEFLSMHFDWIDSLSYQSNVATLLMASRYIHLIDAPDWAYLEALLEQVNTPCSKFSIEKRFTLIQRRFWQRRLRSRQGASQEF
jgi:hypothetical protein